jgi:hypothetical protein
MRFRHLMAAGVAFLVSSQLLAAAASAQSPAKPSAASAAQPGRSTGTIQLMPPPAPAAASTDTIRLVTVPSSNASADTVVRPVAQVAPKQAQGPISVQGPKSAAPSEGSYVAAPQVRPSAPYLPFAVRAGPPAGPPPPEIRDLATLSEPPASNTAERLAETASATPYTAGPATAIGAPALSMLGATTVPSDTAGINAASIVFGALGLMVAAGTILVTRRLRP